MSLWPRSLVLQSSRGRESWLLYLNHILAVVCGSVSLSCGAVGWYVLYDCGISWLYLVTCLLYFFSVFGSLRSTVAHKPVHYVTAFISLEKEYINFVLKSVRRPSVRRPSVLPPSVRPSDRASVRPSVMFLVNVFPPNR